MFTIEKKFFDLQQIAESGQCFRMNPIAPGRFSVISGQRYLEVAQDGTVFTFECPEEDVAFWLHYFDLDGDYESFVNSVDPDDAFLLNAVQSGSGIRILYQDPWEMIITFILSQQKTIPKIKEAVERLCCGYGTKIISPKGEFFTFPSALQLCEASLEDLKALKLGYRAKYVFQACRDCAEGILDLSFLSSLSYEEALAYLTSFYGIGMKVANCVCLFGLHHIGAFPVDTWIKQILLKYYYQEKYACIPKNQLFQTMVKESFGRYQGYGGVMQQYIFYYERTIVQGKS